MGGWVALAGHFFNPTVPSGAFLGGALGGREVVGCGGGRARWGVGGVWKGG